MKRPLPFAFTSFALVVGAAACVDLFHSTDFETLCDRDPAACVTDASGSDAKDAKTPETGGPAVVELCAKTADEAKKKAAQTCAWIGHCLGTRENNAYADCYVRALLAYDCEFNRSLRPRGTNIAFWSCLSAVDSCESVNKCIFGTAAPSCEPTGGSGTYTACTATEGVAVVSCGNSTKPTGIESCALRGQKCTKVDESTALCTGARGNACDDSTAPKCDGTFAVHCVNIATIPADKGTDCALVGGGECFADDAGPGCTPSPDASEKCKVATTSKVVCDEDVAESCVDGKAVRIDCASLGQKCSAAEAVPGDPVSACSNPVSTCTATEDVCSGSFLHSCRKGRNFVVDCSKVSGMETCGFASLSQWEACRPK